jgi:putative protease
VLSPRDLAAHDRVADLLRAGVVGFKIEGRLKGPAYVAAATRAYREALDAAIDGRPFDLPPDRAAELLQSFSRGFTRGFLDGTDHRALVDPRTPKHRGTLVGTVAGKTPEGLLVAPRAGDVLKPGDGILIECGGPDAATQGGRVYEVLPCTPPPPGWGPRAVGDGLSRRSAGGAKAEVASHTRGSPLRGRSPDTCGSPLRGRSPRRTGSGTEPPSRAFEVRLGRDDVDLTAVPLGSRVWKTDDPAMRRRLEGTFARDAIVRRAPVTAHVEARLGEPLRITLADGSGRSAPVESDRPLERAERHPLTIGLLREQLGRLGDTPFELGDMTVDPLDPVMVPKSVLNDLRRRAVEELLARRREAEARPVVEPGALEALRAEVAARRATDPPDAPALHVLVRTMDQLEAVLTWAPEDPVRRPATVWCDLAEPAAAWKALARVRPAGPAAGLTTPRLLLPGEEGLLRAVLESKPDTVLVRSLGALAFFREAARGLPLVADASLNAVNELSIAPLLAWGAARVAPGMDLDADRLKALAARVDPALLEIVAHRHAPMFHTVHCLYAANLGGGRDCAHCERPCDRHRLALEDRKGARHPVHVDAAGRNTVFHGTAHAGAEALPGLLAAGLRHVRVELLEEGAAETRTILDVTGALLAGRIDGKAAWKRLREASTGGLLRGMAVPSTVDKPDAAPDDV